MHKNMVPFFFFFFLINDADFRTGLNSAQKEVTKMLSV